MKRRGLPLRSASECHRIYALNESYFDVIDTEEKAYWLGFIAADGCVYRDALGVCLDEGDAEHLEKLRAALASEQPLRLLTDPRHGNRTSRLQIHSQRLTGGLMAAGIIPAKSFTLLPWAGPPELLRHYWRGVVDGDGSVGKDGRGEWFVRLVGSRAMAQGFADFVAERTGWQRKEARPHKTIWHVGYVGVSIPQAIATVLYKGATTFLDRKKATADELLAVVPLRKRLRLPRRKKRWRACMHDSGIGRRSAGNWISPEPAWDGY